MKRPTFFYGHTIVASGFGIQAIGIGTCVAFGVFFKPLLADFDWSRATLSGAHFLAILIAGLLGILVGRGKVCRITLKEGHLKWLIR